jgi:hypothetical protein
MLHLAAAGGGPSAGGEFGKIMRHADLWITGVRSGELAYLTVVGSLLGLV